MAPGTTGSFQAKEKSQTRAAPNRVPRTPSKLEGCSAEVDGGTLGAGSAAAGRRICERVSLAQGGMVWASLQTEREGGQVH